MKTTAVVFPEACKFELRELTLPDPGPGDVVVKTIVSAISPGTERWTLVGKHIGSQFPCVPGYHRVGVVESAGSDVTQFKPGDVVYGSSGSWAEDIVSMWGAHVGYSVSAAGGYKPMPEGADEIEKLEALAFAILAGVSNRGVNMADFQSDQKVLAIGAGIVGICEAQLASSRGAETTLLDKNPDRIAYLAKAQPNLRCLSVDDPDLESKLKEIAPDGFDILHDTVGHAPTTDAMVQLMRGQGTLLLQAQYFDKEKCAIDLDQIKIKELTVKTTCGTRQEDWDQTTAAIRSGVMDTAALITHRFAATDALEGYDLLLNNASHNLGMTIRW